MKIYGHAGSINVRKVLWACAEIGLDYEQEDWGGRFASNHLPEFLRMNPVGQIPVLEDEGVYLWESNSILRYLAGKAGRADLLPSDPMARAQVEKWMDWQVSDLNNAWRYAFMAKVRQHADYQDDTKIEASWQGLCKLFAVLDAHLNDQTYMCGQDFTLADIVIGLSLQRFRSIPLPRPVQPSLEAYFERLCLREGFRRFGRDGGP